MKKLLLFIVLMLFTTNICLAEKNWFDIEVAKIRTVKEAQVRAINDELQEIVVTKEKIYTDYSMNSAEKAKQIELLNRRADELTSKKMNIEQKYKKDKADLKRRWKNGDTKSVPDYSTYSYTETTEYRPITTKQEYTTTRTTTQLTGPKEIVETRNVTTKTNVKKQLPEYIQIQPKPEPEFKVILN